MYDFICTLSMIAFMWGLIWAVFIPSFMWLAVSGLIVGCIFAKKGENKG